LFLSSAEVLSQPRTLYDAAEMALKPAAIVQDKHYLGGYLLT